MSNVRSPGVLCKYFRCRAPHLGFSLDWVRALLALADGEGETREEVERIVWRPLRDGGAKRDDPADMEGVLSGMDSRCAGGTMPDWPLIEALFEDTAPPPSALTAGIKVFHGLPCSTQYVFGHLGA